VGDAWHFIVSAMVEFTFFGLREKSLESVKAYYSQINAPDAAKS
jgi:hypothetical protein